MSQEAFELALTKLPDYMISNLVEYIESGKDFCYNFTAEYDGGIKCCVIGAGLRMDLHGRIPTGLPDEIQHPINDFIQDFTNIGFSEPKGRPQSELKRIILAEAERRGMIKKELEIVLIAETIKNTSWDEIEL